MQFVHEQRTVSRDNNMRSRGGRKQAFIDLKRSVLISVITDKTGILQPPGGVRSGVQWPQSPWKTSRRLAAQKPRVLWVRRWGHSFKHRIPYNNKKIKHECFFSKHKTLPIFGIRANLSFSLVLIWLSSGGTDCFTTVYRGKKGKLWGTKERPTVGRPDGPRCPNRGG